jgi:hypothetical protein
MERIRIVAVLAAACLAAGAASAQDKKKDDKAATGPFELPALATVKEKCKTNDEQNGKLETIYKDATTKESDTRKTAKDSGSDKKDLDRFLLMGKVETVNKIKEVLDKDQQKTFNDLCNAGDTKKKKK